MTFCAKQCQSCSCFLPPAVCLLLLAPLLHQLLSDCTGDCFGNAVHLELFVNTADVSSDCIEADTEMVSALLVRLAANQALQNLLLAFGKF